jgi:hypothetical protein
MHAVDDIRTSGEPGEPGKPVEPGEPGEPGERRLERPPSDRYKAAVREPADDGAGTQGRAVGRAVLAAVAGAVVITVSGGILAITAGLLVIAAAIGWAVAAGLSTSPGDGPRVRRTALAAALAVFGVALGQLGLWLVARQEGGTLGLVEYLGEVFGILVPLELAIAGVVAWWRAR